MLKDLVNYVNIVLFFKMDIVLQLLLIWFVRENQTKQNINNENSKWEVENKVKQQLKENKEISQSGHESFRNKRTLSEAF